MMRIVKESGKEGSLDFCGYKIFASMTKTTNIVAIKPSLVIGHLFPRDNCAFITTAEGEIFVRNTIRENKTIHS